MTYEDTICAGDTIRTRNTTYSSILLESSCFPAGNGHYPKQVSRCIKVSLQQKCRSLSVVGMNGLHTKVRSDGTDGLILSASRHEFCPLTVCPHAPMFYMIRIYHEPRGSILVLPRA